MTGPSLASFPLQDRVRGVETGEPVKAQAVAT